MLRSALLSRVGLPDINWRCPDSRSATPDRIAVGSKRSLSWPPNCVGTGIRIAEASGREQKSMRSSTFLLFGLMCWQVAAPAQTITNSAMLDGDRLGDAARSSATSTATAASVAGKPPLTPGERWREYLIGAFGPGAILRAAASGGISQWQDTPKEWKQGSEAFGERFGNAMAKHVVRKSLEAGAAAALHEDNRYYLSTDTGFWKRTRHAVSSAFLARNDAGQEHFGYSRVGAALGSSFISRAWQPPSENSAGAGASSFGITMAVDMGWNMFKEFCPRKLRRRF